MRIIADWLAFRDYRPGALNSLNNKPSIIFLLNSLTVGGAERQVVSLLNRLDRSVFRLSLAYLKPVETLLPQLDVTRLEGVLSLDVQRKLDHRAVRSLTDFVDQQDVSVIVSASPYPALYSMLASRGAARRPAQVEIYHATDLQSSKQRLQMVFYKLVFRHLDLLVFVSQLQQSHWSARGLRAKREIVIHNGIDTEYFADRYPASEKYS